MLTYTFSRREKVLLVLLALVLLAILWFVLIYQSTTSAVQAIEDEIGIVNEQTVLAEAQQTRMAEMRAAIEQRKASNTRVVEVPEYDNMQNVMRELNTVLSTAATYTLSFDDLQFNDDGTVRRGATIDFTCASFGQAEVIVSALYTGQYPCSIDSVAIDDRTPRDVQPARAAEPAVSEQPAEGEAAAEGSEGQAAEGEQQPAAQQPATPVNPNITARVHVTFFERR